MSTKDDERDDQRQTKRRRIVEGSDDEEVDDKPPQELEHEEVAAIQPTPPDRLIIVNFETTTNKSMEWPLAESTVARINLYASKLPAAKRRTQPSARVTISDDDRRDRERMLETMEYLTTGYLLPVNTSNTPNRLNSLKKLWNLCTFAATLGIPDLEDACVARIIEDANVLSLQTRVEFAAFCCDDGPSGVVQVTGDSEMGQWIMVTLADNLDELDKIDMIDSIKKTNGALKDLLLDVVVQRLRIKQE